MAEKFSRHNGRLVEMVARRLARLRVPPAVRPEERDMWVERGWVLWVEDAAVALAEVTVYLDGEHQRYLENPSMLTPEMVKESIDAEIRYIAEESHGAGASET